MLGECAVEGDAAHADRDWVSEADSADASYAVDGHGFREKLQQDLMVARTEPSSYCVSSMSSI